MRLLDTTCRWRRFTSSLGCELLTWGFATSGLAYILLVMLWCCGGVDVRDQHCDRTEHANRRVEAAAMRIECEWITYGLSAWYEPLQGDLLMDLMKMDGFADGNRGGSRLVVDEEGKVATEVGGGAFIRCLGSCDQAAWFGR